MFEMFVILAIVERLNITDTMNVYAEVCYADTYIH